MWFFYLKFFLVEIWLTLATWSKSRINHYHHPLLNGPGMLTEYFWVRSFPLHFCWILDTTTEHFRPYLEGGVVVFLIPSNLHTVRTANPETVDAQLFWDCGSRIQKKNLKCSLHLNAQIFSRSQVQEQVRQGQARQGGGGKSKRRVTSKDSLFHHHHPNFYDFFSKSDSSLYW